MVLSPKEKKLEQRKERALRAEFKVLEATPSLNNFTKNEQINSTETKFCDLVSRA